MTETLSRVAAAASVAASLAGAPCSAQILAEPDLLASPHPVTDGQFGVSVAGVTDIDGDGRGDVLVGAMHETAAGQNYAGRAYAFSGVDGSLLLELTAPTPEFGRLFGSAVAGVPDADGDGRGDLLVGAPGPAGVAYHGWAYLYSGATGELLLAVGSPAAQTGGLFGIRVAGVPDADGDGRGDLLVGASHETVGSNGGAGRAYLFSGATGALLRTLESPNGEPSSFFGKAVAGMGDVDGDGRGDLLVGAFQETVSGLQNGGRAYLFSGATGALLRTIEAPSPSSFAYFGRSVSPVPDADGDGRVDMIVGSLQPVVHLFSGAGGAHVAALVAPSPEAGASFGNSVAGLPDLDGDGRGDLAVGAPFSQVGPRVFVYSGATRSLLAEQTSGNDGASRFGASLAGVPDADGDGRGDLIVGAPEEQGPLAQAGRAYLYVTGTVVATAPSPAGALTLAAPQPHPVTTSALVPFTLPAAGPARLSLHDTLGREVAVLGSGARPAGSHDATLDASGLASGVYVLRLEAAGSSVVRRVVVSGAGRPAVP